jgi:tetratricopeptide (TPR) repeat protein
MLIDRLSEAMGVAVLAVCLAGGSAAQAAAPAAEPGASKLPPPAGEPREADLPAAYFGELAELKARYKLYAEALALYTKAVEKAPGAEEQARYQLGIAQVLDAQGRGTEAAAAWKQLAGSSDPAVAGRARLTLARRLAEAGQTDEAIKALEDIALRHAILLFRQTAAVELGKLLLAGKRTDAKLKEYQERLAANPRDRVLLDLVLALQKDDPKGRSATLAALNKDGPFDVGLLDLQGEALIQAGALDEAARLYRGLKKDMPNETRRANERLANIAVRQGRPAEAEELLVAGAADMPKEPRTELYLARQCLALGLWAAAEKHARAAYEAVDDKAMKAAVGMELGEALFRQGKLDAARPVLRPIAEQELWRGLQLRAQQLLAQFPGGQAKD